MENLLLPSKIEFQDGKEPHIGTVVITPCYHGYGTTLGNAYRRVLLSSLPGSAVEAFKVKGIQHEFSTIEGVKEDGVEIILNLKQLAIKVFSDEPVVLHLVKRGPGIATASDFEKNSNVEIVDKNLKIATLTEAKTLEMDIVVGRGRGYKPAEEKDRKNYDLGTIVIDSVYTPIKDIGYHVEYTRVGNITNYEKLAINIETNGTITPREALRQATQILMDHFNIIMGAIEGEGEANNEKAAEEAGEKTVKDEETPSTAEAATLVETPGEQTGEEAGEKKKKRGRKKKA